MKTLITGVAGTGKSTIAKVLREKVEYSPVHSREWFVGKKRICDIEKLKEIVYQQEDIVVTGVASGNIGEYLPLFDKVLLLQTDPENLIHRLQTRTNLSGYGKTKIEQDDNVEWQKEFDPKLLSYGAIPISTEGNIETTVENVIRELK